tara:strand:+ start:1692 stop:2558 length:867 start_codon:yes stop_codon:yes gene_type:complete
MVVPHNNWMSQNGFMDSYQIQGNSYTYPNYKRALTENGDIINVIAKIGELMAERGFPLISLEKSLESLAAQEAEDAMLTSKTGADVSESPIDKLKKVAKADIEMGIRWDIITQGPKKKVDFTILGTDSYTNQDIASASGSGEFAVGSTPVELLREAVLAQLDNFNSQLQAHFDDMFENGRKVSIRVKVWGDWEHDLETEDFGDDELGILIEDWISDNTVNNKFSTVDVTENMMFFNPVRIPLYNEKGRAIDARRWANGLRKYLKNEFEIPSKLMMNGLGQATLVLGGK